MQKFSSTSVVMGDHLNCKSNTDVWMPFTELQKKQLNLYGYTYKYKNAKYRSRSFTVSTSGGSYHGTIYPNVCEVDKLKHNDSP